MKKLLLCLLVLLSTSASATNYLQPPAPRQHIANAPIVINSTGTSSTGLAANTVRTGLECTNTGSATAYLAFGANAAVSGSGLALTAGSTWWMDDYMFTNQAVQVIGITTLSCTEYQ